MVLNPVILEVGMRRIAEDDAESYRVMLRLLDAVERDPAHSQRHLASELGVALGLVNAYLKRCIKKGLVKVQQVPTRRYAYYLTPKGFAEKSRLTVEYLSSSFEFFREAKTDCFKLFQLAKARDHEKILLIGQSDLAEIAALCAIEQGVEIVGLVQQGATQEHFVGIPVFPDFDGIPAKFDCVFVTDVADARANCEAAIARFGLDRVLIPDLLRIRIVQESGAAK